MRMLVCLCSFLGQETLISPRECKEHIEGLLHWHTHLAVDEAGPRPRKCTSTADDSQEAGLVVDTTGGSVTYWKGSGFLACMAGRPTLGSTYCGEGSLLRQHESHFPDRMDSYHTTLVTSLSGSSQIWCPPLPWIVVPEVGC